MGRLTLIARLVFRDLHHRPAEAVLLLFAITAAVAQMLPALGAAIPARLAARESVVPVLQAKAA